MSIQFNFNYNFDPKYSQPVIADCTANIVRFGGVALTVIAAVTTLLALYLPALQTVSHLKEICGYTSLGLAGATFAFTCVHYLLEARRKTQKEQMETLKREIEKSYSNEQLPHGEKYYTIKWVGDETLYFIKEDQPTVRVEVFSNRWSNETDSTYPLELKQQGYQYKNFVSRKSVAVQKYAERGEDLIKQYDLSQKLNDFEYCIAKIINGDQQPIYIIITRLDDVEGRPANGCMAEFFLTSKDAVRTQKGELPQEYTYRPELNIAFSDE